MALAPPGLGRGFFLPKRNPAPGETKNRGGAVTAKTRCVTSEGGVSPNTERNPPRVNKCPRRAGP